MDWGTATAGRLSRVRPRRCRGRSPSPSTTIGTTAARCSTPPPSSVGARVVDRRRCRIGPDHGLHAVSRERPAPYAARRSEPGSSSDGVADHLRREFLLPGGFTGKGVTVVVFAFDGFDQGDMDSFADWFSLPKFNPELMGDMPPQNHGEATMDLQMIHAIAPDAKPFWSTPARLSKATGRTSNWPA